MDRSATAPSPSVSVAELLEVFVSKNPVGAVTVAVFTRLPVADALMFTVKVIVTELPDGKVAVLLMLPVPLVAPTTVAPPEVEMLQLPLDTFEGKLSAIVAPVAVLGPLLLTTIV